MDKDLGKLALAADPLRSRDRLIEQNKRLEKDISFADGEIARLRMTIDTMKALDPELESRLGEQQEWADREISNLNASLFKWRAATLVSTLLLVISSLVGFPW